MARKRVELTVVPLARVSVAQAVEPLTEMFESAFQLAPTGVAVIGMDGRFMLVNRALCKMLGRCPDEIVGSTSAPFTHSDDFSTTDDAFRHLRDEGSMLAIQKRYVRPDGEVVCASTYGQTVKGADGEARYIVSHFLDVTAVKLAEQRHREASRLFETAFADAPTGMALFAPSGRLLKVNRALCELTGYEEDELLKRTFQDITHPEDLGSDRDHMKLLISGDAERYSLEERYRTAQGQEIWVNRWVSVVRDHDQDGQPLHFIAHVEPISERREMQASLRELAERDPLTGIWNRRRFEEELHLEAARCKRYAERSAVLMIDLDEFKNINDTHGHDAGDELLKLITSRLHATLRESDSIARIGGDEFAVILPNIAPDAVGRVADKLCRVILASRITLHGTAIGVGASIGSQMLDEDAPDEREVMARADAAMYQVKSASRSKPHRLPTSGINPSEHSRSAEIPSRTELKAELQRAMDAHEFTLRYQPIIDLERGDMAGMEALVRWEHPSRGTVSPVEFIPLAEESGLIAALGHHVLWEACKRGVMAQQECPRDPPIVVSVNVSAFQLQRPEFVGEVAAVLGATGITPPSLVLELTESAMMKDMDLSVSRMKALRALGVKLAIDDFGSGYSSLMYLRRLPVDFLKIDRSFIEDVSPEATLLMVALVKLARIFKLRTVVEGVEDETYLKRLRETKCDYAQGFHFAKPLSGDEVVRFAVKRSRSSEAPQALSLVGA